MQPSIEIRADAPALGVSSPACVLVVDDDPIQRRILSSMLTRWGYEVREAGSGEAALELCDAKAPDIVVSDWMMPGMDGTELCRRFRAREGVSYGYFVLLTSKTETLDVAEGLDAGADDFLLKPVEATELRARLNAGHRILEMERELTRKNAQLERTLAEFQALNKALDDDLIEAKRLQQSLVTERYREFGTSTVSLLLRPSGHVGGDLVGVFPTGPGCIGLFAIDVAGHGVTSALMTARLAGYLSETATDHNIAMLQDENGRLKGRPPGEVATLLNSIVLRDLQTEIYFTFLYAEIERASGALRFVQAGHPHPAILRAGGEIEFIGDGGIPVGLLPDADFSESSAHLEPGDRLLLMSDGMTEREDASGMPLEEEGIAGLIRRNAALTGTSFLEALYRDLSEIGKGDFADDVSAVLFEFGGPDEGP
ncbi:SpoIIE family protein phosphatase [Roseicyclus sp. F158]|uniref:SpoIIE family protein phosphatase n=1 Tax=Tropicimonas omnivorans TaxID=3075590 RepID=A0ABU3DCR0_9RHOB|nr:SpoIIE family protein phosphatase [Roseicyclus sp. F158]MDT0681500.1 SpoIIE family protein phosphatase [Roseicyclus sp. F158]